MTDLMRDEYDALPDSVRQYYSYDEYRWMSEAQRADLIQSNTEPDYL